MSKAKPSNAGGARQPVSRTRRDQPQAPRTPKGAQGRSLPRHPADEFTTRKPRTPLTGKPASQGASATPGARRPVADGAQAQDGVSQTPRPPRAGKPSGPKVQRARKMAQRHGSQKAEKISRELRDKRVDVSHITEIRLQKALAQTGIGSRRDMEELIAAGQVEVNGKVAELGCKITPDDKVRVQGKAVYIKWPDRLPRIIIYHKQEGELVTRDDPEGRVTVFERLPQTRSSKWVAVGRLDLNTSGLLVLTTSGELANRMMHPSFEVEREYAVRTLGELTPEQMQQATRGVELDDGPAHFQHISEQGGEGANHWYKVILREGRNREVRRLFEHFGLTVSRLIRVRFGSLHLPTRLKRGQFHELDEAEVLLVLKWAGLGLTGQQKP